MREEEIHETKTSFVEITNRMREKKKNVNVEKFIYSEEEEEEEEEGKMAMRFTRENVETRWIALFCVIEKRGSQRPANIPLLFSFIERKKINDIEF